MAVGGHAYAIGSRYQQRAPVALGRAPLSRSLSVMRPRGAESPPPGVQVGVARGGSGSRPV